MLPQKTSVLRITNYEGKVIEDNVCKPENTLPFTDVVIASETAKKLTDSKNVCKGDQVVDPRVAYIITDILRDNVARSPSFGLNSQLVIKGHSDVAVKTGTSNNLRDNITIGYNQKYLVAVWVGNNNNSPMSRIASGVTGASPIFNKIMSALLSTEENHDWPIPEKLVQLPICPYTGTLACTGCPIKMEWFLEENKPEKACQTNTVEKILSITPIPQILDEAASTVRTPTITPKPTPRIITPRIKPKRRN
jgi:membrane carboxypeptidase/penicillin-binding protein PbpC